MINDRTAYMRGYCDGKMNEREMLYVTIDKLLIKAAHDERIEARDYCIIEKTLLEIKRYLPREVKK